MAYTVCMAKVYKSSYVKWSSFGSVSKGFVILLPLKFFMIIHQISPGRPLKHLRLNFSCNFISFLKSKLRIHILHLVTLDTQQEVWLYTYEKLLSVMGFFYLSIPLLFCSGLFFICLFLFSLCLWPINVCFFSSFCIFLLVFFLFWVAASISFY